MKLPLYILAGGRSSRFGSDKARALAQGRPLIHRVAQALQPRASRVSVVAAEAGGYADLDLRTIADRRPGRGPLAGLDAALHDLAENETWLLLVSCDLLNVGVGHIDPLLRAIAPQAAAVAYRADWWEPLCALYHRSLRDIVSDMLASDDLAMHRLLARVQAVAVTPPPDLPPLAQANTPCDLSRHVDGQCD